MVSYSQRFLRYHLYISNIIEDILAVTLCLPFTIALHTWNTLSDILTEIPDLPERTDRAFWTVGRSILLVPLNILKGIGSITLAPLLALGLALQQADPGKYPFFLGHIFQVLAMNALVRLFVIFSLPTITNGLISLAILLGILSGGVTSMIASAALYIEFTLEALVLTLPYIEPWLALTTTASFPLIGAIALVFSMAYVEGSFSPLRTLIANKIDKLISHIQLKLIRRGINTFNNKEDIDTTPVEEIPLDQLFLSSSNHAFDIAQLEKNVDINGLQNYHFRERTMLDAEDFLRLEEHLLVKGKKFPQLAAFLQTHKEEYVNKKQGKISVTSIDKLDNLALALLQPQDNPHFAENLTVAKEAFDAHLATVGAEEKQAIETLNILGGTDPIYQLKNVLEKVFAGNWCKKGASRLISETNNRVKNNDTEGASVFWQRSFPTHWMRF